MNAGSFVAAGGGGPFKGGGVDGGVITGGDPVSFGVPFWLGLGLVDVVDRRAWTLHPKKVLRRCRQLLDAVVVVVVPTAPAMGEAALKPLPLLSSLYPWGRVPPDENPYSVPPLFWSSG